MGEERTGRKARPRVADVSRILVHVEGETEENFVKTILAPHLYKLGYTSVSARLLGKARRRNQRGGIRSWPSVRADILNHLKEDRAVLATTMVDYYALPPTWPGRKQAVPRNTLSERAASVEQAILKDISASLSPASGRQRFVPYVVMHEFEGLLFSDPDGFARGIGRPDLSPNLQAIRDAFRTPEEINDSLNTAPSKRIRDLYQGYRKPLRGVRAAEEIGLDSIRGQCPLFNRWIEKLEQMAQQT